MGAYENPPLIRDRSAEIWAQLGDITPITTAITAAQKFKYDERIKYEEEVKKRNKEISAVNIKARLSQTEEVMKQYNVLKETDSSLAEQYLEEMKVSMNGRGKPGDKDYVLGTIEAETKLITDTDLNSEQQGDLTNYIISTKAYAKNNITLASANKLDADEIKKIGKGEYGNRYVYMGKNEKEQFTAQALSNAMNRNGDVGFRVDSSKTIYKNSKGENGEAIIDFQFAMDKNEFENTAAYKKILADGEELPELKDGQYIFKFNGDQNKLKNGLVIDLGEAKDLQNTYEQNGILNKDKSGNYTFAPTAFIGKGKPHTGIGRLSNEPGKEEMTERTFLNMDAINNINFESDAAYVLGDGSDENVLKVLNGRYGIKLDVAREILENNDEEGLGEILKKEAEKTMLEDTFWMKGDELSKSEIAYFRENGITVNPEERYYFKGTGYKVVNKPGYNTKPTTVDLKARRLRNTQKLFKTGIKPNTDPKKIFNQYSSDNKNVTYKYEDGKYTGGAGEFLQKLKDEGSYSTEILENFIPMHDGSPFDNILINDTRAAQIASNHKSFGIDKFTPYANLEKVHKDKIDALVEDKIKESRFTKKMDLGYVYDRKTGTVVDTEEMLNKISQRDYVPIQRLD